MTTKVPTDKKIIILTPDLFCPKHFESNDKTASVPTLALLIYARLSCM